MNVSHTHVVVTPSGQEFKFSIEVQTKTTETHSAFGKISGAELMKALVESGNAIGAWLIFNSIECTCGGKDGSHLLACAKRTESGK